MSIGLGGKFFMYKFSKWLCALWNGAPCRRSRDILFSTMQKNYKFETFIYNNKNGCDKKWWEPKPFSWFYKVGNCEKSMELGAFVKKLCQFRSEYLRKDQHRQRGF